MASLSCQHLVREFAPGQRAVDDVSLEVDDGELMVLVGPSGCGKSTLLRLVAGLDAPDSGLVKIGGRDVTALTPPERNVAMVFQDYALYPHMTVRRNLEFPLRVRGDSAADRKSRVDAVAEMLGLDALMDRLPKELSGGQRQRVAMGRALVREPAVSLLDEPLSNLDAKLRSEVRAEIADLQRRTRTTMVYVTHDQVEAMTLGQRVAVLDRGVLQQVAPPAELYDRPANAFVAGFLGSPPMNLLPAEGPLARSGATTAGIRPEHLRVSEATPPGATGGATAAAMEATVEHVELLGHESLVHVVLASGARMIARMDGTHRFAPGHPVFVCPDSSRLHFFDSAGRRCAP